MRKCILALVFSATVALATATAVPAAEFGLSPCQNFGNAGSWTFAGIQNFSLHGAEACGDELYLDAPVPTASELGPGTRSLIYAGAPIKSVELRVVGRDLSAEGFDYQFAVCSGASFPAGCGIPVRGAVAPPFVPRTVNLTTENGGIPPRADRIVLYGICTKNFADNDYCDSSTAHVSFTDLHLVFDDETPPVLALGMPSGVAEGRWLNSPPSFSLSAFDNESGIALVGASDAVTNVCVGQRDSFGCDNSITTDVPFPYPAQGPNPKSIVVQNRAGLRVTRDVGFKYDSVAPGRPLNLSAGATNGWVNGSDVLLRWRNSGESLPTRTSSGVAAVKLILTNEGGGIYPGATEATVIVPGEGIESAPIVLDHEDQWTISASLIDAAGNEGSSDLVMVRNQLHQSGPPGVPALSALNAASAISGYRIYWSGPGQQPTSGVCGYRIWVGSGSIPDLAHDPGSQLVQGDRQNFDISPTGALKLADGENTVALAVVDCAGNVGPVATRSLRVDRAAPVAKLSRESGWLDAAEQLGLESSDPNHGSNSGVASTWYRLDSGPVVSGDGEHLPIELPEGRHTVEYGAVDRAGNRSLSRSAIVGADATPPSGLVLPAPGAPGSFRAAVVDSVSGVTSAWAQICSLGAGSCARIGDRFADSAGSLAAVHLNLQIPDDGSFSDGDYRIEIHAADAAGNSAVILSGAVSLPLRARTKLSVGLARSATRGPESASRTQELGRQTYLRGRLLDQAGNPIAGGQLTVIAHRETGISTVVRRDLTVSESGRFATRLDDDVSREVEVIYGGDERFRPARGSVSQTFRAGVRIQASKRIVTRGRRLVLRGQVSLLSASVPPTGKRVLIHFCSKQACSQLNLERYTDSTGAFTVPVPTNVRRRTVYRLRAIVRAEGGWPFADGGSQVVTVVVR